MNENDPDSLISLGDSFGDIAISVNGALLKVRADGSVVVCSDGPVHVYTARRAQDYQGPGYLIDGEVPVIQGVKALVL
jgi:hypothetical protein